MRGGNLNVFYYKLFLGWLLMGEDSICTHRSLPLSLSGSGELAIRLPKLGVDIEPSFGTGVIFFQRELLRYTVYGYRSYLTIYHVGMLASLSMNAPWHRELSLSTLCGVTEFQSAPIIIEQTTSVEPLSYVPKANSRYLTEKQRFVDFRTAQVLVTPVFTTTDTAKSPLNRRQEIGRCKIVLKSNPNSDIAFIQLDIPN